MLNSNFVEYEVDAQEYVMKVQVNDGIFNGLFCVLIGGDGSGKSTLLAQIRGRCPDWFCVSTDPKDLYPTPGLKFMEWALETHPREYVQHMHPLTRSLFFMKTLAIQVEYHVVPALRAGRIIINDSYYYRHLAKETLLNQYGASLFVKMIPFLPRPDLIICIDVPLDIAFARKLTLSPFEYCDTPDFTGFMNLQTKVAEHVRELTYDIPLVRIDGVGDRDSIVDAIIIAVTQAHNNRRSLLHKDKD